MSGHDRSGYLVLFRRHSGEKLQPTILFVEYLTDRIWTPLIFRIWWGELSLGHAHILAGLFKIMTKIVQYRVNQVFRFR